jgi:hypothetical protein
MWDDLDISAVISIVIAVLVVAAALHDNVTRGKF